MSKNSEAVKRWRNNAKERLIRSFGGCCCVCGYSACREVFEFHHLDPSSKETSWGAMRSNIKGWDTIVEEMKKCVMVCSNCHKEIHAGFTKLPENIPRMNLDLVSYRGDEHLKFYDVCPVCLDSKKIQHKTCHKESCRLTTRIKKVDWSKQNVFDLVETHGSYEAVGDLLGVSGAAVSRRFKQEKKKIDN
jgi:hypothetical protein